MGNQTVPIADRLIQSVFRSAATVVLAGLLLTAPGMATLVRAQQAVAGSELAGVTFPIVSNLWIPDASRSQAASLDQASLLVERACGPTEFLIWDAIGGERDTLRARIDTAFAEAGWSLGVMTIEPDGERVYLATRRDEELVMAWLPRSEAIGLVLCEVTGPRTAETAVAEVADPAQQFTPLPRPRPDPNAPVIPLPEPEPVLEPDDDAIAEAINAVNVPAIDAESGDVGGIIIPVEPAVAADPDTEDDEEPADAGSGFSFWLLVVAIALAAGAFALLWWSRSSAKAIAGASWRPTLATVIYAEVATETVKNRGGRDAERFVPVIAYEYEIDGAPYQAARLRFGDTSSANLADAEKVVERFPVGAGIEIRYDPNAPSEATIESDTDRFEYRMIAGIALAVLAVAALISAMG